MNAPRHQFQLNKRDGKLLGVCAGVADYTGADAHPDGVDPGIVGHTGANAE